MPREDIAICLICGSHGKCVELTSILHTDVCVRRENVLNVRIVSASDKVSPCLSCSFSCELVELAVIVSQSRLY